MAWFQAEVTERVAQKDWPDRLRRGVTSALRVCCLGEDEWAARGYDVHHVVAAGLEGALPARAALARWSIHVNNLANAAIIPRNFHREQGLHRLDFLRVVNTRIASADMFATALKARAGMTAGRLIMLQTLQAMGTELVLRSDDAVAIRLQAALIQQAGQPAEHGAVRPASVAGGCRVTRGRRVVVEREADRVDAIVLGPGGSDVRLVAACG